MSASVGFKVNSATAREIAGHLGRCDDLFIPPLSSHTEIDGYAQKIRRHAVRFEAWAEGNLVGLVAAYLNDEDLNALNWRSTDRIRPLSICIGSMVSLYAVCLGERL